MSLTLQSLAATARRKTLRAQRHVELAEADLQDANKQLEQAIPLGDTEELARAHEQTQRAEAEVSKAAQELQVAEELLMQHVGEASSENSEHGSSGEGIQSVMRKLKSAKPKA